MSGERQLERPTYFFGQLLTADELELEQQYFITRLRRHNRFLHGWGVAYGLRVSVRGGSTVCISPGAAIDCDGNDLVCETSQNISISQQASQLYVALRFCESRSDMVPTLGQGAQASRVRESTVVELLIANPSSKHRGIGPGTPGCGAAHPVCIATLRRRGTRWRVVAQLARSKRQR